MDRRAWQVIVHRVTESWTQLSTISSVQLVQSLSRVQLSVTLWTIAFQASLSMGFSQQEYRSGLPFPPPGDLPDLGLEYVSLISPAFAGRVFFFFYH